MIFCPACGVNYRDGVFYTSRVVRNPDNTVQYDEDGNAVRVYDTPLTPVVQNTRICKYAKKEGCINSCKQIDPNQTFEARSLGSNIDNWYSVAKDLLKHD